MIRKVTTLLLLLYPCNHKIISRRPCNLCTPLAQVGQRGPNALVCGNWCGQGLRRNITLKGHFVHSGHSKGNALANSLRLLMSSNHQQLSFIDDLESAMLWHCHLSFSKQSRATAMTTGCSAHANTKCAYLV